MKKISLSIALITLLSIVMVSCGNTSDNHDKQSSSTENTDPNDHPKKDRDHKKGPRPGGEHSPVQEKTLEEIGGYNIGDVATDFELENVDGTMFSLADIENAKGYIVTFTCNECPFSKMYEDRLIELHTKYAPLGYSVVAINPNSVTDNEKENAEAMQKRATEKAFPFVYLIDEGQTIYPQYGAVRTPHVFLLDQDRRVQYIGTIDDNSKSEEDVNVRYVEDAINALENGEKPNPNFTKAIGCPVKGKRA